MANIDSGAFSGGGGGGGTSMNYVAGEAIDITKKSNTGTVSVKYDGSSIILNENGELMANIPEPEPTELYNAGQGINITDRVISVKHDETISVNESGQLHVVSSGGSGSDSLFEKHKINLPASYDWTIFDDSQKVTINDVEVQFNEFQNFPHEYEPDSGVIVKFFTDDESVGKAEIRKQPNGTYEVPYFHDDHNKQSLNPDEYVNIGSKLGIVGMWPVVFNIVNNNVQLKHTIEHEDIFSYNIIKPKEDLPVIASNLDFTKVDGVDEYIIDFKNIKTVKKDNFNYLYFINVPEFWQDTDVIRVSLSSLIKDVDGNEFGEVVTSFISGAWKVPVFTLNTPDGSSYFTLEYKDYTEGPGISFSDSYTSPYEQFMRGELFFKWIPETHAIESKVLKCQTIQADNALKLYHTPIPFFYTPKKFGEVTIEERNYWFIDWGFSTDSED